MAGVLVDEQSFPFDSPILSPMFENAAVSRQQGGDFDSVSGHRRFKLVPSDLGGEDFFSGNITSNHNPVNVCGLPGLDFCNAPPPASPETESPRMLNVDRNDEFGQKTFTRNLSKLGGSGLVTVSEELMFGGELPGLEGLGCENGGGSESSLGFYGGDLKGGMPIPMASAYDNSGPYVGSPVLSDAISALQKFLPSNNEDGDAWPAVDVYACDEFRMYEFKVRRCMRGRSHDWTECPFAHPGEKARRRDPRRIHYSGTACPDFRKGSCRRGDACEFAHGVFECWLHPARYRTQPCKDGRNCKRRVCFFAHTPEQLRLLPASSAQAAGSPSRSSSSSNSNSFYPSALKSSISGSYDGSPLRQALAGSLDGAFSLENWSGLGHNGLSDGAFEGYGGSPRSSHPGFFGKSALGCALSQISSPTSTLVGHSHSPPPLSPPLSPSGSPPMTPDSPNSWSAPSLARSLSGYSSQGSPQSLSPSLQASLSQIAFSQVQASIAAATSSNSASMPASAMSTHGPSPLSSVVPAHRRHLDRLQSMPSISVPNSEGRDGFHIISPRLASAEKMHPQAVNELLVTLQHLELRARAAEANRMSPAAWPAKSPSVHSSQSLPGTPTKSKWAGQVDPWEAECDLEPPLQRVESGRDLRAKIYGRLCKENPLEGESPDFGWVNELVK